MAPGKPNVRLVCAVLARGAIVGMAAAVLMLIPTGGASAAGPFDLEGVFCMDVYLDASGSPVKGDPADYANDQRSTKILSRIEPHPTLANTWNITSVAYSGPGTFIPDKPPSTGDCRIKGDGNSLNPSVDFQQVNIGQRPTATAEVVTKGAQTNLEWERCQFEADLLGGRWVLSQFELVLTGKTMSHDFGILTALIDPSIAICTGTTSPNTITFVTILDSTVRTATKGEPQPGVADDWDGDRCSDWDELTLPPVVGGGDPFNRHDCGAVGGIAELPEVAGTPLETPHSSGPNPGLLAGVATAVAVGAVTLGGAAWYVRRRRPD